MKRCTWCNLNNPKYIEYHDHEWGKLNTDEKYLFEMLILESFQAGLSWQCILNNVNFPQYLYIYTNKHPVVLSQRVFFYDSFNACTILLTLSI